MNELKSFHIAADEVSWRTPNFRQNVVSKIDEFIQKSGMPTARNSIEMENHVFQKAKTKEEYLSMVARLILHVRDINTKKGVMPGPGTPQAGLPGGPGTGQGNPGGASNPNQPGHSTHPNQTPISGAQGMAPDPINALQNLASQGSRNNQMLSGLGQVPMQITQSGMGGMPGPAGQGGPQQNPPQTASNLLQTLNQRPQAAGLQQMPKMVGAGPSAGSAMGPGSAGAQMPVGGMPGGGMPGGGMPGQMNNPNMPGGMVPMPGQMVGPNQMQGQLGNMGGGQMNMMHMQGRKPGEGLMAGMAGIATMAGMAGMMGAGAPRGGAPSQFLRQSPSPSAPSPAGMGGPSPASMVMGGPMASPMSVGSLGVTGGGGGPTGGVGSGGVGSPALVPSPSSHHPQQHSQHMPPHQRSIGMAPSPSSSLNTPLGGGAVASPLGSGAGGDEHAYRDKVRQLSKYIEPLRRMIARMVNDGENVEKMTKMKNFLDILSHPSKRMPLETLLKCEVVLEKLDFKRGEGMSLHSQSNPLHLHGLKEHQIFNPLLEVVNNSLLSPVANHTLKRTFGPCVEALCGPEIRHMPLPLKKQKAEEPNSDIPDVLQGEIARLDSRFKVSLEGLQVGAGSGAVRLVAQLEDARLPCVPPVSVAVPRDYPASPPSCLPPATHYAATPFLRRVGAALQARLAALPRRFSLSQLLDTWEMSVRQACSPVLTPPVAPSPSVALLGI